MERRSQDNRAMLASVNAYKQAVEKALGGKNDIRNFISNRDAIGTLFSGVAALIGIAWFQLRGMKKSLEHSNLMSVSGIEFELGRKTEKRTLCKY
jgi:hypothetical protein